MAFHDEPLFEVNRFAPWELFCSAYRAGREAENAKSPIERLHFNREMLQSAFASMEATLNYMVQKLATAAGEDKTRFIRYKKLTDKLAYIEERIGQPIVHVEFDRITDEYGFLRNETAHPKRTDQQAQFHVQHLQPQGLLRLLQMFLVRCYLATDGEFPYWITGWNYTGFNGNWRDLYLSNNGNGFSHTLGRMDFPFKPLCGAGSMGFANAHMATLEDFDNVQNFLDGYPREVEPMSAGFPQRPRLIRRWWLPGVIEAVEGEVFEAMGWKSPRQRV
jgi:hypothetical protein